MFEADLSASLLNLQRILNFYPLKNLASNELFFITFINSIYFYKYNSLKISLNASLSLNSCKVISAWSTV
ncbi:hypothetical protein FVTDC_17500 [Fusobacterium vincentii]|nr:hypothetical protein FVTDC_17500 [Fusobacterium vincentii]